MQKNKPSIFKKLKKYLVFKKLSLNDKTLSQHSQLKSNDYSEEFYDKLDHPTNISRKYFDK